MIRSTEEFRSTFKAARRAGTPLVAVRTADPSSAMAQVAASLGTNGHSPVISWDILGGLVGRNDAGKEATMHAFGENASAMSPPDLLLALQRASTQSSFADAIVCLLNPQRLWEQVDVLQGIWNLRDTFKVGGQTLVLVATPGAVLPVELQNDVMVIDEPLPSPEDLRQLVIETFEAAEIEP